MNAPELCSVYGVGVFTPTFPNADAWVRDNPSSEPHAPKGTILDRRSRRRASAFTKALADAYHDALQESEFDPQCVQAVFGSAFGELDTMLGLLDQMWRQHEPLSPMGFALSVHNAASGVVSISSKNQGFTTSLGADHDTPAMALMEAVGLISAHGTPVVVVCGDEATPNALVPDDQRWEMAAAALVLGSRKPGTVPIGMPTRNEPTLAHTTVPPGLAGNPQIGMLDLVRAVRAGVSGSVALDRGLGSGWSVQVGGSVE